ncbi:hypothetical protein [Bacillus pumilus]|uniref:hypothetical protein n=1 Tax=Bacillus pumilus TaxID=1408 RepID=UPI001642DEAC|nr:hypothetical protein [Bacillus pumilus]
MIFLLVTAALLRQELINSNGRESRTDRHETTLLVLCSSVCLFFNPTIFVGGMWQLYF